MPPRIDRASRRAISAAALKFATLRRVAPAQTLPRGERGPRLATDLQPRPVPQSTPPEPKPASAGFCVSKNRILGSASELVLGVKCEDATARFLRRGFPYGFSRGILCSAYTAKYPIPASGLPAQGSPATADRNVRNAAENVVSVEPGRIAIHYTVAMARSSR